MAKKVFALVLLLLAITTAQEAGTSLRKITSAIYQGVGPILNVVPQFAKELFFLSNSTNSTVNSPLAIPLLNVSKSTTTFIGTPSQQSLWGLLMAADSIVSGVAVTLKSNCFLRYEYNSGMAEWFVTWNEAKKTNCTNAAVSAEGIPLTTISSEKCVPASWSVYTNVSASHPAEYFAPRLSNGGSIILPFSFALTQRNGVAVNGVVNINSTLTFLSDLIAPYIQPDVVIYVMGLNDGFPLLANSVGEVLYSNGELVPATAAANTMIKQSAIYWSTQPTNPSSIGTAATFTGTNGAHYVTAASTYKGTPAVNWLIVAVTIGEAAVNPKLVAFGPPQIASAIATTVKSSIFNIIRYANSLVFLTGLGAQPLSTPIIVTQPMSSSSANKNSVTRVALWGSLQAFGYTQGYESLVVDQATGSNTGFSLSQLFQLGFANPASGCGPITGYAAIPQNCVRFYSTDLSGNPLTVVSQVQYDVLNQTWYRVMAELGTGIFFGSINDAQLGAGRQGVVLAVPLFDQAAALTGAIEIFFQTSVLSSIVNSITQSYANVSYIIDPNFHLLAASPSVTQPFVTPGGYRLSALNSTNDVLRVSANYLYSQGVFESNTFTTPFANNSVLEISLQTITSIQGIDIYWSVVTVSVISLAPTLAPTPTAALTPTQSPTSTSNSDANSILQTQYDVAVAGIVLGSLAALAIIGGIAVVIIRRMCYSPSTKTRSPVGERTSDLEVSNSIHTQNSRF